MFKILVRTSHFSSFYGTIWVWLELNWRVEKVLVELALSPLPDQVACLFPNLKISFPVRAWKKLFAAELLWQKALKKDFCCKQSLKLLLDHPPTSISCLQTLYKNYFIATSIFFLLFVLLFFQLRKCKIKFITSHLSAEGGGGLWEGCLGRSGVGWGLGGEGKWGLGTQKGMHPTWGRGRGRTGVGEGWCRRVCILLGGWLM